jgi:diadenosine tetraphosphate (Ap4A) HIT family hydrolase|tara:strand:+ start:804 stop:1244 length:441 start_codon:yes stop_codon:yes gene_type:complete
MKTIYEDNIATILLVDKPTAKGHIQITSKRPVNKLGDLSEDELEHLFTLANMIATTLFEVVQAQGTNIISDEKSLHVIARKENDELNFQWTPKQLSTGELDAVTESISNSIANKEPEHPPKMEEQHTDMMSDEEENYFLKQLERIP